MSAKTEIENINDVLDLRGFGSTDKVDLIKKLVANKNFDENNAFYVADLDEIIYRLEEWKKSFPRVKPLYAVKNNNDCKVLRLLSYLGLSFECSSLHEIEDLVKLNVPTEKMIHGNPSKSSSHIKYCHEIGVKQLVFDNEYELIKIRENHPDAECLLRIKCDSLPAKFGASLDISKKLISKAIEWKMNLIGVSFYVGFRQKNSNNIIDAIKNARYLFDYTRKNFDYLMSCLDIGGGFPGTWQSRSTFLLMADSICSTLDEHFPDEYFKELNKNTKKFHIIAELGTYFTCSAYTLCVSIIAKKDIQGVEPILKENILNNGNNELVITGQKNALYNDKITKDFQGVCNSEKSIIYYINDSVYGSFKWYSLKESLPIIYSKNENKIRDYVCSCIGGGTCDSGDFILKNCIMPEMDIGDFFIFRNMGSYTKACAIDFCGIDLPETIFVACKKWDSIQNAFANKKLDNCQTFKNSNDKLSAKNILKQLL